MRQFWMLQLFCSHLMQAWRCMALRGLRHNGLVVITQVVYCATGKMIGYIVLGEPSVRSTPEDDP